MIVERRPTSTRSWFVSRTGGRPLCGWSWEPAGDGPFIPRVRYRRTILRYVGRGVVAVTEPPGGPGAIQAVLPGPAGRHLLELVVPLARRETVPSVVRRGAVRVRDTGRYLPGGRWLSLAIRTPACELFLPSLAALASDLAGHYDTWFWLRYHTPEHRSHIRARFRGDPATLGSRVLSALCAWCQEMIRQRLSAGFTVEPYDQEIERYGGPAAIGAAEHVFAADSSLALAILATVSDNDQSWSSPRCRPPPSPAP